MQEHILIVDDDKDILELLEYNLSHVGYDVLGLLNSKQVRKVLSEEKIDLIIMDRNLQNIEGSLFVEMLRNENINTPVIFLSAKNTIEDIKDGFLRGADDYVTKPFNIEELILRIKAVLKRYKQESKNSTKIITYRDIRLNPDLQMITIDSQDIVLTKLETALLKIMILNKGKVLERDFFISNIWNENKNIHKKTVNVSIKRLNDKIDPDKNKEYIKTIRGKGYILP